MLQIKWRWRITAPQLDMSHGFIIIIINIISSQAIIIITGPPGHTTDVSIFIYLFIYFFIYQKKM